MKACIAKQQLLFPPSAPAEKLHTECIYHACVYYKQHHELTSSYLSELPRQLSGAGVGLWVSAHSWGVHLM